MSGGEIRVQGDGGAIGVKMTGDLAKAVMVPWDRRFVEKLEKLSVNQKLYCRYVDDQNIVVEVLSPGSRYNREEDKIEIVGEFKHIQVRTATIIKRDGTEISRSFHRHVVAPDISADALANESADVQAISAQVHTDAVKAAYAKHLEDSAPE